MEKFKSFYLREGNYTSKATSIKNEPPKKIIDGLISSFKKSKSETIIDYGCGKPPARFSIKLKEEGFDVFSYDPFWGSGEDGWSKGKVSNKLPNNFKFDGGFSANVLNVVDKADEKIIIDTLNKITNGNTYHIIRDKNALVSDFQTKFKMKSKFFIDDFLQKAPPEMIERYHNNELTKEDIHQLTLIGLRTGVDNFQRLIVPKENNLKKIFDSFYKSK